MSNPTSRARYSHQRRLKRLTRSDTAQDLVPYQLAERSISADGGHQPLSDRPDGEPEVDVYLGHVESTFEQSLQAPVITLTR